MNQTNLNKYAQLAHQILNRKTQYKSNKKLITSLFKNDFTNNRIEQIKYRLTIIDSYYSTQMNKRLYGIEQIAESISKISDKDLKEEINRFLNTSRDKTKLLQLLYDSYGINKEGNKFGKATSLISKYLYFLNDYNFPIYDSLVLISYPLITRKKITNTNYFESLKILNKESNVCNYEKLDNLLWLIGKIIKGSFSILMDIDKYKSITAINEIQSQFTEINNTESKNKSILKDNSIRAYITNNYKEMEQFNNDEKSFFDFVFNIE